MYSRDTEIRHLQRKDVHSLACILDDSSSRNLMEFIPKYNHDQIRQIDNAMLQRGETRLYAEMLMEEWGSSGQRHERPTVGLLLQLLVKADLFRAADFVAEKLLNEPKPPRPQNGPGAPIDISFSEEDFDDIKSTVEDSSFYPDTTALNDNANFANSAAVENNKDYYTKYQRKYKQLFTAELITNDPADAGAAAVAPIPPLRRAARLQQQKLLQQQKTEAAAVAAAAATTTAEANRIPSGMTDAQRQGAAFNNGIDLLPATQGLIPSTATTEDEISAQSRNTVSTNLSEASIPLLSILGKTTTTTPITTKTEITADADAPSAMMTDTNEILPNISALNLNGERVTNAATAGSLNLSSVIDSKNCSSPNHSQSSSDRSHSSSLSNDDESDDNLEVDIEPLDIAQNKNLGSNEEEDDDEDNSIPILSILDQRSSNNDSSLTTVTGTSGENSFELSMNDNGSSASNENIPCLSALKQ